MSAQSIAKIEKAILTKMKFCVLENINCAKY